MAQYGSIATLGALNPVPESPPPAPGSPDGTEMGMAAIMARLSTLEEALAQAQAENRVGHAELEKVKMENGKLREALITTQYEEKEADKSAAVSGTGAPAMPESFRMTRQEPAMPESFLMTPQKPAASSPRTTRRLGQCALMYRCGTDFRQRGPWGKSQERCLQRKCGIRYVSRFRSRGESEVCNLCRFERDVKCMNTPTPRPYMFWTNRSINCSL
jgi:hypothetical protein